MWTDDMHELCEKITDEISEANKKLDKNGGKMSAGDLEYIDKLTHALKSIKTTLAMEEYDDDYSGARNGRGRNAKRDSMGRYSSNKSYDNGMMYDNRMMDRRYSRDKEDIMEQLRELEMNAEDGEIKRMIRSWIKQAEK